MTDIPLPDHATIERIVQHQPLEVLARIGDSIEAREAKRLIKVVTDLTHIAREKSKTQESES